MAAGDFIDEARIFVRAGDGGRGCASFRREKFVPKGGPDGGDGGRGGSVVFVGDRGLRTLYDARHRRQYKAARGAHGKGARKTGRGGGDLEVRLPLGTLVKSDEDSRQIHELLTHGERFMAAEGGIGGRGNARFATSTNRAPDRAEEGRPGEERWLRLELKLLADVGLIGFPNAGKSTLVSSVSEARPRIASYPFTTLEPSLGMVERGDLRFVIADIPGLIPDAHRGAGLGQRFLRHVERTRVLVHLLDPQPALEGQPDRDPASDYAAIRKELEAYASELADRPEFVVLTKADLVPDLAERSRLEQGLPPLGSPYRWISAVTREGLEELVGALGEAVTS